MDIVVLIIMCLVSFSYLLKLTFHGWIGRVVQSVVAAGLILLTYDLAASQSKTRIADWLTQPSLMLDISVLLTIDVAFQIIFCVLVAKTMTTQMSKTGNVIRHLCLWVPGILIFPTLFAILTEVIFSFTGVDFATLAWCLAIGLLIIIPILVTVINYVIPEIDLRLEMMFMINLLIAAMGIVATVNGRTAAVGQSEIEWGALIGVIVILIVGIIAGLFLNKYLTRKKISKSI